jgi:hypothetical protein
MFLQERRHKRMKLKSITALIVALGFLFGFLGPSYAEAEKIEAKGTVAKVEGQTVLLSAEGGKTLIIKLQDVQGIRVGDKVEVKGGTFSIMDKTTGKAKDTRKLRIDRPT